MAPSSPVRLGTIGYGIMGERLLRVAREYDQSVLGSSGAWDPSPEAMARYKSDFPDGKAFASIEELLAASDVVHVASPPAYHLDQLESAVAAGLAVHCEKPLGVDVAKAEAVLARMEAAGARAASTFRSPPASLTTKLQHGGMRATWASCKASRSKSASRNGRGPGRWMPSPG